MLVRARRRFLARLVASLEINFFKRKHKMKITKKQLRRIIKEEKARIIKEQKASAMGQTGMSDKLFKARDNLLGLIELLKPNEIESYIDSLIEELEMMKSGM